MSWRKVGCSVCLFFAWLLQFQVKKLPFSCLNTGTGRWLLDLAFKCTTDLFMICAIKWLSTSECATLQPLNLRLGCLNSSPTQFLFQHSNYPAFVLLGLMVAFGSAWCRGLYFFFLLPLKWNYNIISYFWSLKYKNIIYSKKTLLSVVFW